MVWRAFPVASLVVLRLGRGMLVIVADGNEVIGIEAFR